MCRDAGLLLQQQNTWIQHKLHRAASVKMNAMSQLPSGAAVLLVGLLAAAAASTVVFAEVFVPIGEFGDRRETCSIACDCARCIINRT